jgi:hypothetical protein
MTPTERPNDRDVVWIVMVGSAAMLLWMARSLFSGQVPFTGDLLHFHYPLREFYSDALAQGQRFEWMPSLFSGFDVAGEGQLGAYHPLHWLWYRVLPLDTAFGVELVAAYPFLFGGMWLFLRRWCDRPSAAFGAMLFAFCGFNLSHGVHPNMVGVVAHLPWSLWAIHGACESPNWRLRMRWAGVLAALTGSALLLGHPQAFWLSSVAEAGYALVLLQALVSPARMHGVAALLGGKALGVGIGAIQILATLHTVQRSTLPASDAEFATTFSLPPTYLWQLLHPYLLWGRVFRWTEAPGAGDEFAAYGGAVSLVLVVWWLARRVSGSRIGRTVRTDHIGLCAVLFTVVAMWMATGRHGGLYFVQTWLPMVGQFRAPVRYLVLVQLGLAVISALALMQLKKRDREQEAGGRGMWAPWAITAASALSAAWLVWTRADAANSAMSTLCVAAMGPVLFGAAALLLAFATRGKRWAVAGLVLLALADQAAYGLGGVVAWHDFLTREQVVELIGPADERPDPAAGRIAHGGFPNIYVLSGYRVLDGYSALTSARKLDYRSPSALRVAQVAYAHGGFDRQIQMPAAEPNAGEWVRLVEPVARVRLVAESQVSSQPAVDIEQLDVDASALVTRVLGLGGGPVGTVRTVQDDPGEIRVMTRTASRQLLVVSESFDDGWVADVDGVETAVEEVNGDFIGCVVPPGEHQVTLRFSPSYRALGGGISLGSAMLTLALFLLSVTTVSETREGTSQVG